MTVSVRLPAHDQAAIAAHAVEVGIERPPRPTSRAASAGSSGEVWTPWLRWTPRLRPASARPWGIIAVAEYDRFRADGVTGIGDQAHPVRIAQGPGHLGRRLDLGAAGVRAPQ